MMEFLSAIAALCLIPNGISDRGSFEKLQKIQLTCQQEYIKCSKENKTYNITDGLSVCVEKKKLK